MTDFDKIRNAIIDYEFGKINEKQLINKITKIVFNRPSHIKKEK